MIRDAIRKFLEEIENMFEELEEAVRITTRQPWVLWNDNTEEVQNQQVPFFQQLMEYFRSFWKS